MSAAVSAAAAASSGPSAKLEFPAGPARLDAGPSLILSSLVRSTARSSSPPRLPGTLVRPVRPVRPAARLALEGGGEASRALPSRLIIAGAAAAAAALLAGARVLAATFVFPAVEGVKEPFPSSPMVPSAAAAAAAPFPCRPAASSAAAAASPCATAVLPAGSCCPGGGDSSACKASAAALPAPGSSTPVGHDPNSSKLAPLLNCRQICCVFWYCKDESVVLIGASLAVLVGDASRAAAAAAVTAA